jgi:putative DNA primase/helicase
VDVVELLNELTAYVRRYVIVIPFAAETLALWALHTYGFLLRDVTTYIGLESPQKRCGKTTLLTVLSELVNRPVVASNISSPAFFRVIEETRPTLLIDEADTVLHRNDELRGILNSGYKRKTAYVVRVSNEVRSTECGVRSGAEKMRSAECGMWDRGTRDEMRVSGGAQDSAVRTPNSALGRPRLARFSSWCPKVIATIKHLPETLADRCIVIAMHRKKPEEKCERLQGLDAQELRRKCARFVLDNRDKIAQGRPQIPVELHDRAGEIWEPLLVLADLAGGDWPERGRKAAIALTASGGAEEGAIGALFFDILLSFVTGDRDRLFSRTLIAELNGLGERTWVDLKKGREVTEMWLARQLRPYGIRPRTMWIEGTLAKGYFREDFNEAFGRYIPKAQARAMLEEMVVAAKPPMELNR